MISTGREGSATGSRCIAAFHDSGPWCRCVEQCKKEGMSKCLPLSSFVCMLQLSRQQSKSWCVIWYMLHTVWQSTQDLQDGACCMGCSRRLRAGVA